MKFPNWRNLPGLLTFVHTVDTVAATTDTLLPRSHPASLPICTGPWPPIAPPNHLFFPLLDANIDFRTFPNLVAFCTAPQPANCRCALDDRTRRFEVHCDHLAVPLEHMWGFLYAIQYCEMGCQCVNPEGLQDLRMVEGRVAG